MKDFTSNDEAEASSASFKLDNSPPIIRISKPNDGNNYYNNNLVEFDVNANGSPIVDNSVQLSIVGKSNNSFSINDCVKIGDTNLHCSYVENAFDVSGTNYIVRVSAKDVAGNELESSSEFKYIDEVAPSKVSDLSASSDDGVVTLSWSKSSESDFNSYFVYMSENSGFVADDQTLIGVTLNNSFTKSGLSNDVTYYFKVRADDKSGNLSEESEEVSATPKARGVGGKPVVTSSTHDQDSWVSNDDVEFSWDPVDNAVKYQYSLTSSADSVPDSSNETTSTSVSYENLEEGEKWFNVRACNERNECGETAHYRIRIDKRGPSYPQNIRGFSQEDGSIYLSWSQAEDNYSGVREYEVYRSKFKQIGGTDFSITDPGVEKFAGITENSFVDSGLKKGVWYYYRIRPIDKAGNVGSISPIVKVFNSAGSCLVSFSSDLGEEFVGEGEKIVRFEGDGEISNAKIELDLPNSENKVIIADDLSGSSLEASFVVPSGLSGDAKLVVSGADVAGNYCEQEFDFKVDSVKPSFGEFPFEDNQVVSGLFVFSVDVNDDGSGVDSVEVLVDGNSFGLMEFNSISKKFETSLDSGLIGDGNHLVEVVARDKVGNFSSKKIGLSFVVEDDESENEKIVGVEKKVGEDSENTFVSNSAGDFLWIVFVVIVLLLIGIFVVLIGGGFEKILSLLEVEKGSKQKTGRFAYKGN